MMLDDESLLSAYLDDELDEPGRRSVEAALRVDHRLAARFQELARLRTLLADVDRPGPPIDLAGPVTAAIATRRRRMVSWQIGAACSGLAAALLVFVTFGLIPSVFKRSHHSVQGLPPIVHNAPVRPVPLVPQAVEPAEPAPGIPPASPTVAVVPPLVRPGLLASVAGPDADEIQSDQERRSILAYLDGARAESTSVRRVFIPTEALETTAAEVHDLLRNTPRRVPSFGRITVNPGLVIDPDEPNAAVVFLLVMDEKELNYLRSRMERNLELAVSDTETASAEVVTMLADSAQVDVSTSPGAVLLAKGPKDIPRDPAILTNRDRELPVSAVIPTPGFDDVRPESLPSAATRNRQVSPRNQAESIPAEANRRDPADRLVPVLVWLTSRPAPEK